MTLNNFFCFSSNLGEGFQKKKYRLFNKDVKKSRYFFVRLFILNLLPDFDKCQKFEFSENQILEIKKEVYEFDQDIFDLITKK